MGLEGDRDRCQQPSIAIANTIWLGIKHASQGTARLWRHLSCMPMETMEGGHGQRGKTRALLPCIEFELSEVLLKNII